MIVEGRIVQAQFTNGFVSECLNNSHELLDSISEQLPSYNRLQLSAAKEAFWRRQSGTMARSRRISIAWGMVRLHLKMQS